MTDRQPFQCLKYRPNSVNNSHSNVNRAFLGDLMTG